MNTSFLMPIEDTFPIKGCGIIIVGRVERGALVSGEEIQIVGLEKEAIQIQTNVLTVYGMNGANVEKVTAGEYAGIFLPTEYKDKIERGMVVIAPNSMKICNSFKADIYLLQPNEGGTNIPIVFVVGYANGHRCMRRFQPYENNHLAYDCIIQYPHPETIEWFELSPGENAELDLTLLTFIPLDIGFTFKILQGPQIVGKGTITSFLPDRL